MIDLSRLGPDWCPRIPPAAVVLGRYCAAEHVLDDNRRHRCRLDDSHTGLHECWCRTSYGGSAAIRVFHCPQADCRWARGLEYTHETAADGFAAAAALCSLDGQTTCPLETAEQRARLVAGTRA